MTETSIYIDREDSSTAESEERNIFIKSILEEIGIPLEDVWKDIELSIDDKIALRRLLSKFDVSIVDDGDRGMEIYVGDDIVARWNKPKFILKTDLTKREKSKQIYYEMIISHESVFDEENNTDA